MPLTPTHYLVKQYLENLSIMRSYYAKCNTNTAWGSKSKTSKQHLLIPIQDIILSSSIVDAKTKIIEIVVCELDTYTH